MLKSLISIFAEKFLQNKSEWVGNQAMPDDSAERIVYTPQSSPGEYLAPCAHSRINAPGNPKLMHQ